jgi:hypothetical protein
MKNIKVYTGPALSSIDELAWKRWMSGCIERLRKSDIEKGVYNEREFVTVEWAWAERKRVGDKFMSVR